LKSHWLDKKQNRWIDHVISTLVKYMEPYYQNRYVRQTVGLQGPDLARKWWREILESTRNISADSIQQFNLTQFHVASQSHLGMYHVINLHWAICDCKDFPRIQFCKHIAAIYVHFPYLSIEDSSQEPTQPPDPALCISDPQESLHSLIQDITDLSHQLILDQIDQLVLSLAVLKAVQLAKYSLIVAIALTQGTSALPHKEVIRPNQKSWMKTTECMGVKKAPKWKRLPKEQGLTEWSIGVAKGKHNCIHIDPYARGEQSGTCAKSDVLSVMVNAHACVSAPPSAGPSSQPLTALTPPFAHTPASQPLPAFTHTPAF
jgi:hypothetical protein